MGSSLFKMANGDVQMLAEEIGHDEYVYDGDVDDDYDDDDDREYCPDCDDYVDVCGVCECK